LLIAMRELVTRYGVKPKAVLHVGAHLGEEAEDYQEACAERVLWIEANRALVPTLQAHVAGFPGQRALQATISDVNDEPVTLRLTTFSMASSILPLKRHLDFYPSMPEIGGQADMTTTVDMLLEQYGESPTFDMANLDVEGAELHVLRGMASVMPSLRWIYTEVNHEEMYEGCVLVSQMDDYLGGFGFKRVAIQDAYIGEQMMGFADALYARA
jgi:FkbM family methyltransferase